MWIIIKVCNFYFYRNTKVCSRCRQLDHESVRCWVQGPAQDLKEKKSQRKMQTRHRKCVFVWRKVRDYHLETGEMRVMYPSFVVSMHYTIHSDNKELESSRTENACLINCIYFIGTLNRTSDQDTLFPVHGKINSKCQTPVDAFIWRIQLTRQFNHRKIQILCPVGSSSAEMVIIEYQSINLFKVHFI